MYAPLPPGVDVDCQDIYSERESRANDRGRGHFTPDKSIVQSSIGVNNQYPIHHHHQQQSHRINQHQQHHYNQHMKKHSQYQHHYRPLQHQQQHHHSHMQHHYHQHMHHHHQHQQHMHHHHQHQQHMHHHHQHMQHQQQHHRNQHHHHMHNRGRGGYQPRPFVSRTDNNVDLFRQHDPIEFTDEQLEMEVRDRMKMEEEFAANRERRISAKRKELEDKGEKFEEHPNMDNVAPIYPITVNDTICEKFMKQYADHKKVDSEVLSSVIVGTLNLDDCMETIDQHDITFVVTDTGTGKSSLLPKALIERGERTAIEAREKLIRSGEVKDMKEAEEKIPNSVKVVSSQPRRTAAFSLATRVCELREEAVGEKVGYWVRGEHIGTLANCDLLYMTSYTLLLHILNNPEDLTFTHFLIDEFHERQPDIEVTIALLRIAKEKFKHPFKIVLLSASLEINLWETYFKGLSIGTYNTAIPRFPIHEYFQEEICELVGSSYNPIKMGDDQVLGQLDIKNFLHVARQMLQFLADRASPEHAILFFLPGRAQIEQTKLWIEEHFPDKLDPIEWFRDVEISVIKEHIARPNCDNCRKVYLATDIAEVSVTLPDVVFVIDSGMTKKPRIDEKKRNTVVFPPLETLLISQCNIKQRRGRVGRVQQGFYFSMVPNEARNFLQEMEPQITNSVIDTLALHVLHVCNNPFQLFSLCRAAPRKVSVRLGTSFMLDTGCIMRKLHRLANSEECVSSAPEHWRIPVEEAATHHGTSIVYSSAFVVTMRGMLCQYMPLSISNSEVVLWGILLGLESLCILMAATIEIGTPFYLFLQVGVDKLQSVIALKKASTTMKRYARTSGGRYIMSDIFAHLKIVLEFRALHKTAQSDAAEVKWCEERCASRNRLLMIISLEEQLISTLAEYHPVPIIDDEKELSKMLDENYRLINAIAGAAYAQRMLNVTNTPEIAFKRRVVGESVFLKIRSQTDHDVPSACPWSRFSTVVPLSVTFRYGNLLCSDAVQFTPQVFGVVLVIATNAIAFCIDENGRYTFRVTKQGQSIYLTANKEVGERIINIRDVTSAKMHMTRIKWKEAYEDNDPKLQDLYEKSLKTKDRIVKSQSHLKAYLRMQWNDFLLNAENSRAGSGTVQSLPLLEYITLNDPSQFVATHWSIIRSSTSSSIVEFEASDDTKYDDEEDISEHPIIEED
eukprot:Tbor_TRINITY_DN3566_c0_g1::TRINITY_DN3566_c0_g1_i1::g.2905::m.2905/K13185/DHX30; ATP-dependent RNA helicase DHX30